MLDSGQSRPELSVWAIAAAQSIGQHRFMSADPTPASTEPFADLDPLRLNPWLSGAVPGFGPLTSVVKFPGGQSNPTYRLDDGTRSLVLRRKPFGKLLPSAHAIEREFRVISALSATDVPVPQAYALCEDAAVIGAPFYVMERVEGRNLWDGKLPEIPKEGRAAMYLGMVDALARLHNVDPVAVGLGDYGAPGNYFERQVGRWTKQYRAAETDTLPAMERLIEYLPRSVPAQERTAILHGDYRLDNLIFDASEPRVVAMLDWELSTLGDPLADFSYFAMSWVMPAETGRSGLGGLDLAELGIPPIEQIVERYAELTGRTTVPSLDWFIAFNLFRLAGILQGVKKRHIDGNASSKEASKMIQSIGPLSEQAWHFAERAGAA